MNTAKEWPTNERIENIGRNGGTGCHYRKMVKQFLDIPTIEQAAKPKVFEVKKVKPVKAVKPKVYQRTEKFWCDTNKKYI